MGPRSGEEEVERRAAAKQPVPFNLDTLQAIADERQGEQNAGMSTRVQSVFK